MKKCRDCGNITFANQLIDGERENNEVGKYYLTSYCLACGLVHDKVRILTKKTYERWINEQPSLTFSY